MTNFIWIIHTTYGEISSSQFIWYNILSYYTVQKMIDKGPEFYLKTVEILTNTLQVGTECTLVQSYLLKISNRLFQHLDEKAIMVFHNTFCGY